MSMNESSTATAVEVGPEFPDGDSRLTERNAGLRRTLAFAAIAEIGAGLALLMDTVDVVRWLFGTMATVPERLLGRGFGIALLALGFACWPKPRSGPQAWRGMLIYNGLLAAYLSFVGASVRVAGPLLWPAVVLHAVVAVLLLWTARPVRRLMPS